MLSSIIPTILQPTQQQRQLSPYYEHHGPGARSPGCADACRRSQTIRLPARQCPRSPARLLLLHLHSDGATKTPMIVTLTRFLASLTFLVHSRRSHGLARKTFQTATSQLFKFNQARKAFSNASASHEEMMMVSRDKFHTCMAYLTQPPKSSNGTSIGVRTLFSKGTN